MCYIIMCLHQLIAGWHRISSCYCLQRRPLTPVAAKPHILQPNAIFQPAKLVPWFKAQLIHIVFNHIRDTRSQKQRNTFHMSNHYSKTNASMTYPNPPNFTIHRSIQQIITRNPHPIVPIRVGQVALGSRYPASQWLLAGRTACGRAKSIGDHHYREWTPKYMFD